MELTDYKPQIMVVDDTPANLGLLEEMLVSRGYEVVAFPRGAMALAAAQHSPPDLILLDIMMPEMDGYEVCRKLKDHPPTQQIPVIFISALDATENKLRAFTDGGVDYVTKPLQQEEVLARVKTHLKIRFMQRELERHNEDLENLVEEKIREITDSQMATLIAISNLAEYRDKETGRHIERTSAYCQCLAEELRARGAYTDQISEAFVRNIVHAAPLHDIGKMGIPDHILNKPGKLTTEEFEVMKTHVTIGTETLKRVLAKYPKNTFIRMGLDIAGTHHERWDGKGYPAGIAAENIPLSGRIMALADVYDALRSRRVYKEGFSHTDGVKIITDGRGTQFDPVVVDAFISIEKTFAELSEKLKPYS